MKARHRLLFAWIALLGLLFSQVALSAYACPLLMGQDEPAGMQSHAEMAGMPCAEHERARMQAHEGERQDDQSLLCIQHCQDQQTISASETVPFPPVIAVLSIAPALTLSQQPALAHVQAPFLARTTSPPPLWRSGRLRI